MTNIIFNIHRENVSFFTFLPDVIGKACRRDSYDFELLPFLGPALLSPSHPSHQSTTTSPAALKTTETHRQFYANSTPGGSLIWCGSVTVEQGAVRLGNWAQKSWAALSSYDFQQFHSFSIASIFLFHKMGYDTNFKLPIITVLYGWRERLCKFTNLYHCSTKNTSHTYTHSENCEIIMFFYFLFRFNPFTVILQSIVYHKMKCASCLPHN